MKTKSMIVVVAVAVFYSWSCFSDALFVIPKIGTTTRSRSSSYLQWNDGNLKRTRFRHLSSSASLESPPIDNHSESLDEDAVRLGRCKLGKYFEFPLDDWQLEAGGYILNGDNVIVCAPTGSGKTVVGEMALHSAIDRNLDGVYTTPLKALSNQKFSDFSQIFGKDIVGLSTGDVSINRDKARLTVMTTEVYRNIAWRSNSNDKIDEEMVSGVKKSNNDLQKNAVVVLDEFHYMGQPGRGGVWEECVITSPSHTQIIGLSATLPNALELSEWMESVTGRSTKLIEAPGARPVPLKYLFATREGLFPLFSNVDAGPGSTLGLLGHRGDGIPSVKEAPKQKKKGTFTDKNRLPEGLQVNPTLNSLAQRRVQKVNRILERQNTRNDDFDWYQNNERGRGRGRRAYPREARKERERVTRKEMRKAVPSLSVLLMRLKAKNLLPAIFFIFSRRGCDEAAVQICNSLKGSQDPKIDPDLDQDFQKYKEVRKKNKRKRLSKRGSKQRDVQNILEDDKGRSFRLSSNNVDENIFNSVLDANGLLSKGGYLLSGSPVSSDNWELYSSTGLLSYDEVRDVAGRLSQFNEENPEIAFTDDVVEHLLFGLGCHHAGMLPAHKIVVETLFRLNLMKAVFATETLSSGINMPARTTVICSLAKRGDNGMVLLETSNLLQMAGRAGRRGFDTLGTCVLVATPFEGEDVAANILTNAVKPITSQFRPSYALTVNLITRGKGSLKVAKQLVSKSFSNWGTQARLSDRKDVPDVSIDVSSAMFVRTLITVLDQIIQNRSTQFDISLLSYLSDVLKNRQLLKKSLKNFKAAKLDFELERTTLGCLDFEVDDLDSHDNNDILGALLFEETDKELLEQIDEQRNRVKIAERKLNKHPFVSIVSFLNNMLVSECSYGKELLEALQSIESMSDKSNIDDNDVARFAKSSLVVKKKLKKLEYIPTLEEMLFPDTQNSKNEDSAWRDMIAITRALIAYGCIAPQSTVTKEYSDIDLENELFDITPAGYDIGMLSFENSLWAFLAMGGSYDINNVSNQFDDMNQPIRSFKNETELFAKDDGSETSKAILSMAEAEDLTHHLQELTPGEMAGYISCLVAGDTGRSNEVSASYVFGRLSPQLQRSIQILLDVTERFVYIQRQYSVDESTCNCRFDLSHCEVVTAWANGCTWNEALEISGVAPGDLTRIIGRATDAVRQFGSLKFHPIRKKDFSNKNSATVDPFSSGLHPEIRRLCREAVKDMNRYPVKDPLPFEVNVDDISAEVEDNDEVNRKTEVEKNNGV